jgi:hypothetical protein
MAREAAGCFNYDWQNFERRSILPLMEQLVKNGCGLL